MNETPTSSTPSELRTSSGSASNRREYLAWLLILGILATVVYRNAQADKSGQSSLLQNATARLRAYVLIGAGSIQRNISLPGTNIAGQSQTAISQMEREAQTPEDRFRTAIVAGEVVGKDRALSILDAIPGDASADVLEDISAARAIYTEGQSSLPEAGRERLIRRYGDVGHIALAFGVAPDQEPRKSMEAAAAQSFLRMSIAAAAVLGIALLAVACIAVGAFLLYQGKIRREYVPDASSPSVFLEAFAIYLVLLIGFGWLTRVLELRSMAWNWAAVLFLPVLWLWIKKGGAPAAQIKQAFGLHPGRGWLREVAAGLGGYLAGMTVIVPGIALTYLLVRNTGTPASHPIMGPLMTGGILQVLGLYGIACILAPTVEELMFRGALFHHLRGRWSWAVSAVTVSLIFALLHPQGWAAAPALGSIAIVLAGIREWRASLVAPVAAHALNNFLAITFALVVLRSA